MFIKKFWRIFFIIISVIWNLHAQTFTYRNYICTKSLSQISIDGDLNEAGWVSACARTVPYVYLSNERHENRTTVIMAHDEDFLYLASVNLYDYNSKPAAAYNPSHHDKSVWNDESVELIINTKGTFYHIGINVNGSVYDNQYSDSGINNIAWNSNAQVHTFKSLGAWNLEAKIPLSAFFNIDDIKKQEIRFNFARNNKLVSGYSQKTTLFPIDVSFHEKDKMGKLNFASEQNCSQLSETEHALANIKNGCFELGKLGFNCISGNVYLDDNTVSGKYCIRLDNEQKGAKTQIIFTTDLKPLKHYKIHSLVKNSSIEQPDLKILYVDFKDEQGNIIETSRAGGINNMGGADKDWREYNYLLETPQNTRKAEISFYLDDIGSIWLDRIYIQSLRLNDISPVPVTPKNNSRLHAYPEFTWNYFEKGQEKKGAYQLQISKNKQFESDDTLSFENVFSGFKLKNSISPQGTYYWRVRFKGENNSPFSESYEFTMDINPENEQISPQITSIEPQGAISNFPKLIKIKWQDIEPSSGIDYESIALKINDQIIDKGSYTQINQFGLTAYLPNNLPDLNYIHIKLKDNNKNSIHKNSFFCNDKLKPKINLDSSGFIVRNGKRVFPLSIYGLSFFNAYPVAAENGFNCIFSPFTDRLAALKEVYRNDMTATLYAWGPWEVTKGQIEADSETAKEMMRNCAEDLKLLSQHPAALGFYLGDETADHGVKIDSLSTWNKHIKDSCPNQFTIYLPTYRRDALEIWQQSTSACDMLTWHDYCIGNNRPLTSIVNTLNFYKKATGDHPQIAIIEAFNYADFGRENCRFPTKDEMMFQSIFSVIRKSRGLCFYIAANKRGRFGGQNNPWAKEPNASPKFKSDFFAVSNKLKKLLPVFLLDDHQCGFSIKNQTHVNVECLGKIGNDSMYLILANASNKAGDAYLEINKEYLSDTIVDILSGRTYTNQLGTFTLDFTGYGVKVIKVK